MSIDHLRDAAIIPIDRFRTGDFDWKSHRQAIFDGFHRSLAAYADAGNDLIVEHILDTPGWLPDLQDLLARHDVLFVGVHCKVSVLNAREKMRGNRAIGSAQRDQITIHVGLNYDIEVDGEADSCATAQSILGALRDGDRRSDFR